MFSIRVAYVACRHIGHNKDYPTSDIFPDGIPTEIVSEGISCTKISDCEKNRINCYENVWYN